MVAGRLRLAVVDPCPDSSAIDGVTGYCSQCEKQVHDFRELTRREAMALVRAAGSRGICARSRVDAKGELVFRAEPAPRALPMVLLGLCLAACAPWGADEVDTPGQAGECVLVDEGVWECAGDFEPEIAVVEAEAESVPSQGCAKPDPEPRQSQLEHSPGTPDIPGYGGLVATEAEAEIPVQPIETHEVDGGIALMTVGGVRPYDEDLRSDPSFEVWLVKQREKRRARRERRKAKKADERRGPG